MRQFPDTPDNLEALDLPPDPIQEKKEELEETFKKRDRRKFIIVGLLCLLAGIVVTYGATQLITASNKAAQEQSAKSHAQVQASQNAGAANTNKDAAEILCNQLRAKGFTCLVNPSTLPEPVAVSPQPGPPGPAGNDATDAQVAQAVNAYFLVHPPQPGRAPSAEEISLAVTNYLRSSPPAAGKDATPEQVATAVQNYLTANPPAKGDKGDQGEKGDPGQNATPEQIAAAVQQYLQQNPPPQCGIGQHVEHVTVVTTTGTQEIVTCVPDSSGASPTPAAFVRSKSDRETTATPMPSPTINQAAVASQEGSQGVNIWLIGATLGCLLLRAAYVFFPRERF